MIIQPTSLAALTWAGAAAGTTAPSWRIGSVLAARPLGVSPQGLTVLQIGATTVEANVVREQLPAQFQVRVLSLGAQPQLEMLTPAVDPTVPRALRERLPLQNGYAPLLATLTTLAQRPVLRQLPETLRDALAQLEQALRTPAEITQGEGLRQAIQRSGLFFESRLGALPGGRLPTAPLPGLLPGLASGLPPTLTPAALAVLVQDDWKGALLRLAGLLAQRPAPPLPNRGDIAPPLLQRGLQAQPRAPLPEAGDDPAPLLARLQADVGAALARVEVAQLGAGSSTATAWMIEIPVQGKHGNDVLQLKLAYVDDGDGANGETRHGWNLGFALDLPTLGPVQGELQLREPRLSVRLWAVRADTAQKLEDQFTALRQRLAACGLLLDQLSCQVGQPEPPGRYSAVLLQAIA